MFNDKDNVDIRAFKVVHVVPRPDGGGAERLVRELTARLPAYGIESSALYFCNPRGLKLSSREFALGTSGARDPRAIWKLRYSLKKHLSDFDKGPILVHAHLTWPLYFLPLALVGQSITKLYTEHSTQNKRRRYPFILPLERAIYSRYQRIACISQGTKNSLKAWLGGDGFDDRLKVVPNGSRLLPFSERPRRDVGGIRLVSVGSLSSHKGFDLALRAVALIGETIGQYSIVGEGSERPGLEKLARELGIAHKVRFPGYVDDVTPYFHEADLGLVSSRWEGFSLVAVEGLSTGLPFVATDVEGLREVVSNCDAVHLVASEDVEALANGLKYGAEHLVWQNDIAKTARKCAETFGIEGMVERYADMYRDIIYRKVVVSGRDMN